MLRLLWIPFLVCGLSAASLSCGPLLPASSPGSGPDSDSTKVQGGRQQSELDDVTVLELIERRVADSIARIRDSAVALEYAVAEPPAGSGGGGSGGAGRRRVATGVVVSDRGEVLSIRINPPPGTSTIVARDVSGGRHPAQWIAADADTGLTLLRIDPGIARPVRPASRGPRLGSQVLVIGNPFNFGHSVIRGQVAGLDRRVDVGPRPLGGLIQIDAALHPGDSGALVADLRGEWLGLIRSGLAIPDAGTLDHDLGFVIPAGDALWVAHQLGTYRRVERAYLGVRLNLGLTENQGLGEKPLPGAVLEGVAADTPAARAGLKPGDRVVAFDGHPIETPADLTDRLDRTLANTDATVEFLRGTQRDVVTLHTASRPPLERDPSATKEADPPELSDRVESLERRLRRLEKDKPGRESARQP